MTKAKITAAALSFAMLAPMSALAVGENLENLLSLIKRLVSGAIPVLVGLALIFFIVGLIRFVIAGDAEKREDGKKMMWWGIVALFVIVSIWGIVEFIASTLGITKEGPITPPGVVGVQ
ncbi:MAG TPA: pilin [Candidatus Paceibacterota bacterium]